MPDEMITATLCGESFRVTASTQLSRHQRRSKQQRDGMAGKKTERKRTKNFQNDYLLINPCNRTGAVVVVVVFPAGIVARGTRTASIRTHTLAHRVAIVDRRRLGRQPAAAAAAEHRDKRGCYRGDGGVTTGNRIPRLYRVTRRHPPIINYNVLVLETDKVGN